jgi:hypothetical protein
MIRNFSLCVCALLLSVLAPVSLQAQVVQVGEYKCWKAADLAKGAGINPAVVVDTDLGICRYQALPNDGIYRDLLSQAQNYFPDYVPGVGFNPKDKHPQRGMGQRTIEWWYTTPGWNEALGEFLKLNDKPFVIRQGAPVRIELTMYTFERGFEKELGFDFAGFYGKREVEENLPKLSHSLSKGIFNTAIGLGNPIASYLMLGIEASVGRHRAETVVRDSFTCVVGSECQISSGKSNNYYSSPSSIEIKVDELGLSLNTVPQVNPENPGTILLRDLGIKFGIPTGNATAPVEVHQIRDDLDLVLQEGETYVIGSRVTNRDLKTGKLLSSGSEKAFTHFLVLIRASHGNDESAQLPSAVGIGADRSFSEKELDEIRKSSPVSLREFFDSIELVCFNDLVNPGSRKICGFRFTKIGEGLLRYRLKFSVNGKLKYSEKKEQFFRASDVYAGKGYFQLPAMEDGKPGNYSVTVKLDGPGSREKAGAEGIKGIKFEYRYYPESVYDPVEFSKSSVRWLK